MARTTRWARRASPRRAAPDQLRFGIVQGGIHVDLRRAHAGRDRRAAVRRAALGGLGVGEAPEVMYGVIDASRPRCRRTGRAT